MSTSIYNQNVPDVQRIKWMLQVLVLVVGTIIASFFAVKTGNPIYIGAVIGTPILIKLFVDPVLCLYLALISYFTSLSILRISSFSDASIFFALAALSCFSLVIMRKGVYQRKAGDKILLMFSLVIMSIMFNRGSGLKILGSATWGGSPYLLMFLATFFFLFSRRIRISNLAVRWVVYLSAVLGVANALFQRVGFTASVGQMEQLLSVRLHWTMPIATGFLPLALVINWRRFGFPFLLIMIAFLATAATGFRGRTLSLILFLGTYFYFQATNRKAYIGKALVGALLIWLALIVTTSILPLGMQRALSFVPGVGADFAQAKTAAGSTEWRFEIWKYCLEQLPDYWLLGRGIAFNVWETVGALGVNDVQQSTQWFMFLTHSYHSGPLTLLIDYGLPGMLIMLTIHIYFTVQCFKIGDKLSGGKTPLERFTQYFVVLVLTQIFAYWMMYGKTENLAVIIFNMGLIHIAYQSVLDERALIVKAEEAANEEVNDEVSTL